MAKSEYPLETFVRHILLRRLALTTAVITLGVTLISYAVQRHSSETRIVEVARAQIALLLTRTRAIASAQSLNPHEVFRRALTEFGDAKTSGTAGSFVWTRFYGPDLSFIAEDVDTAYAHREEAAAFVRTAKLEHPAAEETYFELVEVAGDPHLHVVLPVIGARGTVVGYAQGLFAVSATVVTQARRALARNVWIAVSIVLATAALLYPVILRLTARLAWFSGQLLESNLAELSLLGAAIAKRDSDTDAHNYRVTLYSVRLAEAVDLSATEMQAVIKGAFLHDVGKIGIRDVILLKPGRLHEDEFRIMKQHVNHGLDITGRSPWLRDAAAVVGGHHEKFDGSGYPQDCSALWVCPFIRKIGGDFEQRSSCDKGKYAIMDTMS